MDIHHSPRAQEEHALVVEHARRERQPDRRAHHGRRPEDRAADRAAHAREHARLALLADLERVDDVAEDPAARAVVELDLEPVVARAALEHLEDLPALGDVDLAVRVARPRVHGRALRDHAQVRVRGRGRREARQHEQGAGQSHWNHMRKTMTAGSLSDMKMSCPPC